MAEKRKSRGQTKAGIELTGDVLAQLVDEAEQGLDVMKLRKALDERAAEEHTSASDIVREALRRYLEAG